METRGYAGKVIRVDLSRATVGIEALRAEEIRDFIGPEGILFRWAYDLVKPGMDPFSESSPIMIGTGPMVGTPVPASSRVFAFFKHPAYGTLENSHAGGDLGAMLKWAGYDYIVITGKSDRPVYLHIHDDAVRICDAVSLWGKDIFETTDALWEAHDNPSVLAMGPPGERLVPTTVALIDKVTTIGKGGLPAVMGSKRLKAIAVNGSKGVKIADPAGVKRLVVPVMERVKADPNLKTLIGLGTMVGYSVWFERQGASRRNWADTFPIEEARRLFGPDLYEKNIRKDRIACFSCPAGCKDRVRIGEGEFAGLETYGSSFYGRLENIGARTNVGSFNRFVKCFDYFQRMGLCVHDLTAIMDWAVDLYKRGIITREDTGGLELDWNFETTMRLAEQAARNEGFGGLLGGGYLKAIREIGRGSEDLAIHVKGMSPLYDARINRMSITEFGQVVYPKGAHPGRAPIMALYMTRDLPDAHVIARKWAEDTALPAEAVSRIFDAPGRYNIGRLTKWTQERNLLFNSLGIGCERERGGIVYDMAFAVEVYRAVTGLDATAEQFLGAATRSYNLLKVLNLREGFTRKDDGFPDRWFEPAMRHGEPIRLEDYWGHPLEREDCEKILDAFYLESGWDPESGAPTKKRLVEVGLGDIAEDMDQSGYLPG